MCAGTMLAPLGTASGSDLPSIATVFAMVEGAKAQFSGRESKQVESILLECTAACLAQVRSHTCIMDTHRKWLASRLHQLDHVAKQVRVCQPLDKARQGWANPCLNILVGTT